MRDFLDRLDDRLEVVSASAGSHRLRVLTTDHADVARALAVQRPVRRPRLQWGLAGATAGLAAVAAGTVALTGGSATGLPIFQTASADASALRRQPSLVVAGLDFRNAHAFLTTAGPGFVIGSADRSRICVAMPDAGSIGTYGSSCGATSHVEAAGLELVVASGAPGSTSDVAGFVLPKGATAVRMRMAGATSSPLVQDGVVVVRISAAAVLSWTVGGASNSFAFDAPVPLRTMLCPGGTREVPVPPVSRIPRAIDVAAACS